MDEDVKVCKKMALKKRKKAKFNASKKAYGCSAAKNTIIFSTVTKPKAEIAI